MVTIGQFQKIHQIAKEHTPHTAEILTVGVLHGLNEKQVRELPIDSWRELKRTIPLPSDKLVNVLNSFGEASEAVNNGFKDAEVVMSVLAHGHPKSSEAIDALVKALGPDLSFDLKGKTYKVDTRFKISGQFIDFSEVSKEPVKHLHMILALFAVPEGEHYMTNFDQRSKDFLDADYSIAEEVAFFFFRLMRELSLSAKIYSQGRAAAGTKRSGAGRLLSTLWRAVTGQSGNTTSIWKQRRSLTTSPK